MLDNSRKRYGGHMLTRQPSNNKNNQKSSGTIGRQNKQQTAFNRICQVLKHSESINVVNKFERKNED